MCDQCGETLPLDSRGEAENGEDSAWLSLSLANDSHDFCTRSCVHAFLERQDVIAAHDAYAESITGIALLIRDGEPGDEE